jgi:exopolyphosphatase / guanosine-5'-triphosphate,3'-diphosphate pyrophosphatase
LIIIKGNVNLPEFKAVIDIGTNSFRLIIAEILPENKIKIVQGERVIMRLGTEGEKALSVISQKETEKALQILKDFVRFARYYNAEVHAVATSAVREAANRDEFTAAVLKETGISIKVIDGKEEAAFIYKGVQNALPAKGKRVLCIDIGGGSTEVIIGKDDQISLIQSHKLGAVRLTKMFFPGYILAEKAVRECSSYIDEVLGNSDLADFASEYDVVVGASGTVQAVAAVVASAKYNSIPMDINGLTFTLEELKEAAGLLFGLPTVEERFSVKGIEKDRADILPAGVLILLKLFNFLKIQSLTISTYALREGVLFSILKH